MSAWPQQQNGVFPGMLDASNSQSMFDPAMTQMYNGGTINPSQFNNPHMQQRMPNGAIHPQNAFQNPTFNVGQVIPSKRTSDGMAMSPGPAQNNTINTSRSQTPLQPGTPYQGAQPGQQFPNPYQHLQQGGSANASPSPTIQNQQFRQPQPPQRITSQSPANFSQMPHSTSGQISPAPTQQHTMSMSPQASQQNFSPNLAGGAGFGQPFPNQGMMAQGIPGMNNMNMGGPNMTAQMQAQLQQRQYQQQLIQQRQRMQANNMGQRQMSGQMGGAMGAQPGQPFNAGMPQNQGALNGQQHPQQGQHQHGQQPHQQNAGQSTQEKARVWLATVQAQLQQQGKPFNPTPTIAGKPLNLYMIWVCIASLGGSARINAANAWPAVAAKLNFPNNPQAMQDIRQAFEMYLSGYERHALAVRQAQRQQQGQVNARQMAGLGAGQQGSPTRTMQGTPQDGQQNQFMQQQQQQPGQHMAMANQMQQQPNQLQGPGGVPMQNGLQMPGMQGPMTPQMDPSQLKRQQSIPKQDSVPPQSQADASPAVSAKASGKAAVKREDSVSAPVAPLPTEPAVEYTVVKTVTDDTWGGYNLTSPVDRMTEIVLAAQESVRTQTLFRADIRALTKSLQSGISSEVRYAIDSLVDLSSRAVYSQELRPGHGAPPVMILDRCEELLDVIVDAMEEHIDILSEASTETSDHIDLMSFEEVARRATANHLNLRDIPEPGSEEYYVEHVADRLIALLLVIHNLSMDQFNHPSLASPPVISLLSNTIHLIGTRRLFLRTYENTLDFYKFLVTFMSNVAGPKLELSSRDEALNMLHFLLTFAPQPSPTIEASRPIQFSAYHPVQHRYLPPAVDTLAKLLARQEPNRSHFRSIFTTSSGNAAEISPLDLFTRTFGLSIAFLPDRTKGPLLFDAEIGLLKVRKAYLGQGMLAADILASLVPTPSTSDSVTEINLARIWLESDSKWPASLLRMAFLLATSPKVNENLRPHHERPKIVRDKTNMPVPDDTNDVPGMTAHRALSTLLRLLEKAMLGPKQHRQWAQKANTNGATNGAVSEAMDVEETAAGGDEHAALQIQAVNGSKPDDHGEDADCDSDSDDSVVHIQGDPMPRRETITALLAAPALVDTEALKLMDRLYDLMMPKA